MLKKSIIAVIISGVFALSCVPGSGGMIYRAVERGDVEIVKNRAGLIRTLYCDIYIEHLDRELRSRITESAIYKGGGKDFPAEPCFQFIILNTWNKPVTVENIRVQYNNEVYDPEFYDYVKDPGYLAKRFNVNLPAMWKYRRLLGEAELIKEIDYDSDTIDYRADFIAPGDRVLFFRFFRVIPHRRDVKISVTIKYFDMKKIIDFDIGRFEYNGAEEL